MTKSSRLFLFPDINVWVALAYDRHTQHIRARKWFVGSLALFNFGKIPETKASEIGGAYEESSLCEATGA